MSEKPVDAIRPPLRSITLVTTSAAKKRYRLVNERGESLDVELRQSPLHQVAPGLRPARLADKIQMKAGAGKLISGMNGISALAATFRDDIDTFAECVLSDSVPTAPAAPHLPPKQHAQFDAMTDLKQQRNPARPMSHFQSPPQSKSKADEAQAMLTYGSAVTGNINTFNWGFANAKVIEDQSTFDADPYAAKLKYDAEVGSADTRAGFGITGQGVGAVGAFASMGGGIVSLIQLRKKIKAADDSKKAALKLEFAGKIGKTPTSLVEGGARTTAFASGISKALDSKDKAAAGVASWSGTVGGACSALGAAFSSLVDGGKGFIKAIQAGKKKRKGEKVGTAAILDIVSDFLKAGKGFVVMANATIKTISGILSFFKTAATFVQAIPLVGDIIDIAVQTIDLAIQGIGIVVDAMKMARAKKYQHKLAEMKSSLQQRGSKLATYLIDINVKRFKRAWIPMTSKITGVIGSLISIAADGLNIAGIASASAMGAGGALMGAALGLKVVAGGTKLLAASVAPMAYAVRHGKQAIRNKGEGDQTSHVYKIGKKLNINMDKTSERKDAELQKNVRRLMKEIRALQDPNSISQAQLAQEQQNYLKVHLMIKATGLKPKDLLDAAGDVEMQQKLYKAMKERDVTL